MEAHTQVIEELGNTVIPVIADGDRIKYRLTASDRSDCCDSRAVYQVVFRDTVLQPINFCYHHFREHEEAIYEKADYILDESSKLYTNRLVGSVNS